MGLFPQITMVMLTIIRVAIWRNLRNPQIPAWSFAKQTVSKPPRQGILKREEKTGMEFISGESRGQRILFPDCIDDCIRENNAARVI
jgi:hypothetical protein